MESEEVQPSASHWDTVSRMDSSSLNPGKNTSNTLPLVVGPAGHMPEAVPAQQQVTPHNSMDRNCMGSSTDNNMDNMDSPDPTMDPIQNRTRHFP